MMLRRMVPPMLAAWKPAAAVLLALAVLTPARAEDQPKTPPTNPSKKTAEKPNTAKANAPKANADMDKARADVKRLEDEMDSLHRKMFDTMIKLRRAHEVLGEQGGKGQCNRDSVRHERHMMAHFRHGFRHHGEFWRHFAHHMEDNNGNSKLEEKVDQLQKQVEQLQRQLQQKK